MERTKPQNLTDHTTVPFITFVINDLKLRHFSLFLIYKTCTRAAGTEVEKDTVEVIYFHKERSKKKHIYTMRKQKLLQFCCKIIFLQLQEVEICFKHKSFCRDLVF